MVECVVNMSKSYDASFTAFSPLAFLEEHFYESCDCKNIGTHIEEHEYN